MKKVGLGTERATILKSGPPVNHEGMTGVHSFYYYGVLCVVGIQFIINACLYGEEKPIFIGCFYFKVKERSNQKTIQEHEKVQITECFFQKFKWISGSHIF